jgi:hypothetical protein
VTQDVSARLRRVEQQIRAFKELHQSELQLILDELGDIVKQVDEEAGSSQGENPLQPPPSDPSDPAAASPKRAKWLAEQERKQAPRSRRELLFGEREDKT